MLKKVQFIINPFSGKKIGKAAARLIDSHFREWFPNIGYTITYTQPDENGYGPDNSADLIIGMGGDGTASTIMDKMLAEKHPGVFAIIPIGVGNDLARELNCNFGFNRIRLKYLLFGFISEVIENSNIREFDLYSVNNLNMINYFSLGFDAEVLKDFDYYRKKFSAVLKLNFLNKLIYVLVGIRNLGYSMPRGTSITIGNGNNEPLILEFRKKIKNIIITNIDSYAAGSRIAEEYSLNDGIMELTIIRNTFQYAILLLTRFLPKLKKVLLFFAKQYKTDRVTINTQRNSNIQIDGETIHGFDREILVEPKGKILVKKFQK